MIDHRPDRRSDLTLPLPPDPAESVKGHGCVPVRVFSVGVTKGRRLVILHSPRLCRILTLSLLNSLTFLPLDSSLRASFRPCVSSVGVGQGLTREASWWEGTRVSSERVSTGVLPRAPTSTFPRQGPSWRVSEENRVKGRREGAGPTSETERCLEKRGFSGTLGLVGG